MLAAVKRLVARILALRRTASLDREFEDELQSHLVLLTEENIRRGMSPDQARRAASVGSAMSNPSRNNIGTCGDCRRSRR